MKAFMYMVGYDKDFKKTCNTGWGCGYVAIPSNHRLVSKHWEQKNKESNDDVYCFSLPYFEILKFDQEITFTETKEINGVSYLVIGFDTAHSWNDGTHDLNYVLNETAKILEQVENYKSF